MLPSTFKSASSKATRPEPAADSNSTTPPAVAVLPPCNPLHPASSTSAAAAPLVANLSPSCVQPDPLHHSSSFSASSSAFSSTTTSVDEKKTFLLILRDLFNRTESPDFKTEFEAALSGTRPDDWQRMISMRSSAELAAFQLHGFKDSDSCNKLRKKYSKPKADNDMAQALQRTEWLYQNVSDWAKANKATSSSSSLLASEYVTVYTKAVARKKEEISICAGELTQKMLTKILAEEIQKVQFGKSWTTADFKNEEGRFYKSNNEIFLLKNQYESQVTPLDQVEALELLISGKTPMSPSFLTNSTHTLRRQSAAES